MKIIIIGTAYPLRGAMAQLNGILANYLSEDNDVEIFSFKRQYPKLLFPGKSQEDTSGNDIIKKEILFLREKGTTIIFSTHNMSSVEELCDDISLINKSRTILEGSVEKIRNDWAAHEYEVVMAGDVIPSGNSHFTVLRSSFEGGKNTVRLKTNGESDTNEIIRTIANSGKIISFNPALPSMNEIFIRVVEAQNSNESNMNTSGNE